MIKAARYLGIHLDKELSGLLFLRTTKVNAVSTGCRQRLLLSNAESIGLFDFPVWFGSFTNFKTSKIKSFSVTHCEFPKHIGLSVRQRFFSRPEYFRKTWKSKEGSN